ncbi:MAG TPA: hypothetical protein VLA72_13220 [Anaerolineales bacterium]|nr:hypothetical protein [Anaerolineales bacterium]
MKSNLIVIDGKTYKSIEEMSPDVRAKYERAMNSFKDDDRNGFPDQFERPNILSDQDKNGIPDIFEGGTSTEIRTSTTKFVVNRTEYGSLDDLPPDARARYEQAMGEMDKNQNGIPDFAEDMFRKVQPSNAQRTKTSPPQRPSKAMNTSPTISPDTTSGWKLVLLVGFLLFACVTGSAAVWSFFLH